MAILGNFNSNDVWSDVDDTDSIVNYDDNGGSQDRWLYEFGVEANTKLSRTWQDYQSEFWNLDGLRHVVEPYINYTFIGDPNQDKDYLYFFDNIDRYDEVNAVRVGTRQRLQTRREGKIHTFVQMDTFVDYYFATEDDYVSHEGQIGTRFEFLPNDKLSFWFDTLIDYSNWELSTLAAGTTIRGDNDKWRLKIAYLFRDHFQDRYHVSMGSNLTEIYAQTIPAMYDEHHNIRTTFNLQLNEITDFEMRHYFDIDSGELGRQSYEVSREFECWITSLRLEESRGEVELLLLLTLKGIGSLHAGAGG